MTTKTIKMRVDLQNLMLQAIKQMRSPGFTYGFQLAEGCLIRIAERAVELKDEQLLNELDTLCIVKCDKSN